MLPKYRERKRTFQYKGENRMISPKKFAKKWMELWEKEPIKFSAEVLKG